MTFPESVPVSVLVMLFGRLIIRKGLGIPESVLVAAAGRLGVRCGLWVLAAAVLVPVVGRLTIRKGLGMSTSSSQSDQNSISTDSCDPDAILWLVSLLTGDVQPVYQLENVVIAPPPSRKTNLVNSSGLQRPSSSCACKKIDARNKCLRKTS